ncbi:MAG: hypothetical protein ACXVQ3_10115 [Gaiellaceae bacterium]
MRRRLAGQFGLRLLLDPLLLSYYLAGPKALILVGAALGAARWTQLRSVRRESNASVNRPAPAR